MERSGGLLAKTRTLPSHDSSPSYHQARAGTELIRYFRAALGAEQRQEGIFLHVVVDTEEAAAPPSGRVQRAPR